jgi:hypothetical protein
MHDSVCPHCDFVYYDTYMIVFEEHTLPVFYPENGGIVLFRNVSTTYQPTR